MTGSTKPHRPWIWFFLFLPFGASSGYVTVTIGYLANQAGMSDAAIGSLIALNLLPHTWKFLWAPIADTTFSRKHWYIGTNLVSSLTLLVLAVIPIGGDTIGVMKVLIFFNSLAMALLGMAVEGLMAHATPEEMRGRASGWFQAGNLGGAGIGGGLALELAKHVSPQAAGVGLGLVLLCMTFALRAVPEAPRVGGEGPFEALNAVARDLWKTFATRNGAIALVLCFMPLGAGAASGLFAAIAGRWQASAEIVAMINGVGGGVVAMIGCLLGGRLSDGLNRKVAYASSGVVLAMCALGMALTPQTAAMYIVFTLLYMFASGLVYGTFTGFVLDVIGTGAAATKYNALASLSNIPIWYMTLADSRVSDAWGPVAMLFVDAAAGAVGLVVLLLAIAMIRQHVARKLASN
jgi:MFS family permease